MFDFLSNFRLPDTHNGWQFLIIEDNNLMFFICSMALIDHFNNALANSFVVFSEK